MPQEASPNTRAVSGGEATDVLAVTAVVVNDLMQRKKTAEYDFSWDAALASTGGVRMQARPKERHFRVVMYSLGRQVVKKVL